MDSTDAEAARRTASWCTGGAGAGWATSRGDRHRKAPPRTESEAASVQRNPTTECPGVRFILTPPLAFPLTTAKAIRESSETSDLRDGRALSESPLALGPVVSRKLATVRERYFGRRSRASVSPRVGLVCWRG